MKTDDLIARLAADPQPVREWHPGRAGLAALACGGVVAGVMFAVLLGPRPDLAVALGDPRAILKTLLPGALCGLALVAFLRDLRPGASRSPALPALWAVPAVLAGLVAAAWATTPAEARMADFIGHSIHVCLPAIVVMSAPVAAALLIALRRGAPERPLRAAALAGLAAAGFATALYSLFCNEDSPLFYVSWYGLAVLAATGLTAVIGARVLRW